MSLFLDTDDFKRFTPEINRNYDWKVQLAPKVLQAREMHLVPFIGDAQLTELEDLYQAAGGTTKQKVAIGILQQALAAYTSLKLLTTNRVQISNMGVVEQRSDDNTTSPASYHAIADVKSEMSNQADFFLDRALEYMEGEAGSFATWTASDQYTALKSCLIWNTALFNQYVDAKGSRRAFLAIRTELLSVQNIQLKSDWGEIMLTSVLNRQKVNSLTPEDIALLEKARPFLATMAMRRAIPKHTVEVQAGGVFFRSYLDGPSKRVTANEKAKKELMIQLEGEAAAHRATMIKFLDDNASDYPDYTPTEQTTADGNPSYGPPINSSKNKSFRV